MTCLVCGGPVAITPRLFPEADDRWDCLACGTWGTISHKREAETEPASKQDEATR